MDGEDDLREQILQVEADLEELTDAVDRCRLKGPAESLGPSC
jgi:hypothetical protein